MHKQEIRLPRFQHYQMIIQVAVNIPYSDLYDYLVPEKLQSSVKSGSRVLVPLGSRAVIGIVAGFSEKTTVTRLKSIIDLVDREALFDSRMLEFTRWMSSYYLCSWAETLDAALPGGLKPKVKQKIKVEFNHGQFNKLSPEDQTFLKKLDQKPAAVLKSPVYRKQNRRIKEWKSNKLFAIDSFIEGNYHGLETEVEVKLVCQPPGNYQPRKGSKAESLLDNFKDSEVITLNHLKRTIPNVGPVVKKLLDQGIISKQSVPVTFRESSSDIAYHRFLELNQEQQMAMEDISKPIRALTYQAFLLSGVTGSGKTEVYLHAVRQTLLQNRSALILIPEISLTPQAVSRFEERFGERVAVLHSGMSDKERATEWWKIKKGQCDIVIGARSAIFAPLKNIGLIVVDEEHDSSYKQQESPFYNARDAAVKLASDLQAVVILGSATPSIESFYNSQTGKYSLLELTQRANLKPLPRTHIINLKEEKRQPGIFYLSLALVDKMKEMIVANKQILVFLNRRGFAAFMSCKECDLPVLCDNCSIAMTWHKTRKRLICHHCGETRGYPSSCGACHGSSFRMEGFGTQRIEQDLGRFFPDARFLRMDRDTIQRKGALEKSIEMINRREVDFIIGTQLISKGHDFKHIGMVCIVLADMSLNFPDFRSSERSFQLISQVSGRAGRDAQGEGSTLIQTYNPEHFAITSAVKNDYKGFYQQELEARMMLVNPPAIRLILLKISSVVEAQARSAALKLGTVLREKEPEYAFQVLGPIEAPIQKINKRYYWQVLLKSENPSGLKKYLRSVIWDKKSGLIPGKTRVSIDVDPYQML